MSHDETAGQPLFDGPTGRVLVSASEEYPRAAAAELKRVAGKGTVERIGPDLLAVAGKDVSIANLAAAARGGELVFAKHLATEIAVLGGDEVATVADATAHVVRILAATLPAGVDGMSIRAWASGRPQLSFGPGNLAYRVTQHFEDAGVAVHPADQEWTVCLVLVEGSVHLGLNRTENALTDWAGGRIRLARTDEQVSRAEFKLEELFHTFPQSEPRGSQALDLGASPGGWTRIIAKYGLSVTAVDPGDLAPQIAADRQVTHARTTAGEYLRATDTMFDLIVNDMRMDPVRSVDVMLDARDRLRRRGQIIVTLKLGASDPTNLLKLCRQRLSERYRIEFIRQLHHNRHEMTVVATPR